MNKLTALHHANGAVMGLRNQRTIPFHYGQPDAEYQAVRQNILLTDYSHFGIAQVAGEDCWELLNLLVSADVSSIRDEQAIYSLILDEQGYIVTDLYILCDEDRFILLSEWCSGEALCEMINHIWQQHRENLPEIEQVLPLDTTLGMLHFEGPYSWELLGELYGIDVIGLPFLEHMHTDDMLLLRAGKHGEFSYKLIGTFDQLADAWQRAIVAGEKYQLRTGGVDYQRQVRLENPCWQPEVLAPFSRCPVELQMQWMLRYNKGDFVGRDAVLQRLEQGPAQRAIGIIIKGEPLAEQQPNQTIFFDNKPAGSLITAAYCPELEASVGRVMLNSDVAYANINHFILQGEFTARDVTTSAIPFIRNFSFMVNPAEHSFIDPARPKNILEQSQWKQQQETCVVQAD
ncbi:aminomethyltransferase family protein [Winslowiella iniecta]|uniref:aminomethyltransferase family protein n=1 Tax=Winslowiella iniecta TaxID=1560201 RepID=UPI00069E3ED3|nr:aminomethyltransferase family protein [Winslowiella iniecta]